MDYIAQGFLQAIQLLLIGNPETYTAVFTTLKVSSLSIMASLIIGIPLGFLLGYFTFPGKRQMRATVDTLLALPTVVVGLVVYAFVTRRGPLVNWAFSLHFPVLPWHRQSSSPLSSYPSQRLPSKASIAG